MILVLGVTGHTGSETARRLVSEGHDVRGVTRDIERARLLPALAEVPLVEGDGSRPDSVRALLDGVAKVYLVPPTAPGWDVMQSELIAAAAASGVEHIVKLSAIGASPDEVSMSLRFHWQGEQEIGASGLAYTHIRANSFFQNTLFDIATIQSEGRFFSCVGDARFAKIDTRDIADVVVKVLTEDGHDGQTYELTGSETLGYADMAEQIAAVVGTPVEYVDLDPVAYSALLVQSGLPDWMATEFSDIYGRGFYRDGGGARITDTVERLLGRPPRGFAAFAAENADVFRRTGQHG